MPHSKVKVTREITTNVYSLYGVKKKTISIWPTRNHLQHQNIAMKLATMQQR